MNWSTAREHVAGGRLVAIALTSEDRMPDFKDVPTFKELGYPDLVMTTWYAISGPPGLPADIADRLNKAVVASLDDERVKRQLALEGAKARPMSPAETTTYIKGQVDQWRPAVEKLRER
jgi:tripartite-type tricarboxylate transporter receptor subunit TctC